MTLACFDPEIKFSQPAEEPGAGVYHGHQGGIQAETMFLPRRVIAGAESAAASTQEMLLAAVPSRARQDLNLRPLAPEAVSQISVVARKHRP